MITVTQVTVQFRGNVIPNEMRNLLFGALRPAEKHISRFARNDNARKTELSLTEARCAVDATGLSFL